MTPLRSALTALAGLSVGGVAHNYDVNAVPERLSRAHLPALLVLTGATQDESLFGTRAQGFEAVTFSGGAKTAEHTVTHLLLVAPSQGVLGLRLVTPRLVDLIDGYFAALGADVTLGGALLAPARVQFEPGVFTHGGCDYHGCAFRHIWLLPV